MTRITQGASVRLNLENLFEIREKFIGDRYNKILQKVDEKQLKKELTFLTYESPVYIENVRHELCRVRGLQLCDDKGHKFDICDLLIPAESLIIIQQQYQHK